MNVIERESARESVVLDSLGDEVAGALFLPASSHPSPSLIICHGAGDFKENYFELCQFLTDKGIAALALDMHGHGASGGTRFHVNINEWVADVRAAVKFLASHPQIDPEKICGFGISSGGTAILEAALIDSKLKVLIALDATVRNSLPLPMSWFLQFLVFLGKSKKLLTKSDLRLPLAKLGEMHLASDPEVNNKIVTNPKFLEAFMAFPLPGGAQAFFVDTIQRVPNISAPTLVIWGEEDQLDPPETARRLFAALTCKKKLQIIGGNGHAGHMDRHKQKVFELTSDWIWENFSEH
jgi:alpha-beta hydrolase superfamily lysophospholipase